MFQVQQMVKKEIIQAVLRDCYKERIWIFKAVMDLFLKKIFLMFLHTFEFLQFLRKVSSFLSLRDFKKKKKKETDSRLLKL